MVHRFDAAKTPAARMHAILGWRATGKTTLLNDLSSHRRGPLHRKSDVAALNQVWEEVKFTNGNLRQQSKPMMDISLVLDDTECTEAILKSDTLKDIMTTGRHYNLSLYMCLTRASYLKPSLRSQIDYVYIMRGTALDMQHFFAGVLAKDHIKLRDALNSCTEDYGCTVVRMCDFDVSHYKARGASEFGDLFSMA